MKKENIQDLFMLQKITNLKKYYKGSLEKERASLVVLISTLEDRLSNLKEAKNEIDRELQKI